jgi:hypothetical protein
VQFTLKQLSYFIAAGEAGSILRAGENVHVSQPSILANIKKTIVVDSFSQFCHQQISTENIPGMASL